MPLVLTEEQEMLRESARGFLDEKTPVSALRKLRDTNDETGFSRELWKEMADMGFAGIAVPEDHGGVDMGFVAAGLLAAAADAAPMRRRFRASENCRELKINNRRHFVPEARPTGRRLILRAISLSVLAPLRAG